jgi:elongation factor Ts
MAQDVAETQPANLEVFLNQKSKKDPSFTVDQCRAQIVQTLGENIQIKRFQIITKSSDISIGVYSHMGGKIVTAVILTGGSGHEALAREIAMHVAAESPDYLRPEDVPSDVKAREEEIAKSQIKGKPENMIAKIVEGKLKAFYDQVCLLHQKFVKDNAISITTLLENESKRLNKKVGIQSFIRWKVGE